MPRARRGQAPGQGVGEVLPGAAPEAGEDLELLGHVHLPEGAGAALPEGRQRGGDQGAPRHRLPAHHLADAVDHLEHGPGAWVAELGGQLLGPPPGRADVAGPAGAQRVAVADHVDEGDEGAARLACGEGERRGAPAEIPTDQGVDVAEGGHRGGVDVEAAQRGRGDVGGLPHREGIAPQAPEAEGNEVPGDAQDEPEEAPRTALAQIGEAPVEGGRALVDVSREEELLRGATRQLGGALGGRARRGGREGLGRLGAAAGVDQRFAERLLERRAGGVGLRPELERPAIEPHGPLERQRFDRLGRGALGQLDRARAVPGAEEIAGQRLGAPASVAVEGPGQPAEDIGAPLAGEPGGDHLAQPIVVGLELVVTGAVPAAHQGRGAQERIGGRLVVAEIGGARGHGAIHRAAGHGQDLQQPARRVGQRGGAGAQQRVERDDGRGGPGPTGPVLARRPGQLADEDGTPARLAGHGDGQPVVRGRHAGEQRARQRRGLGLGQHGQLEGRDPHAGAAHGAERGQRQAQASAGVGLVAAVGDDEQERRRRGGREQLDEQRPAVGVAPLQVVDDEDERPVAPHAGQHLAQRPPGPAPPGPARGR